MHTAPARHPAKYTATFPPIFAAILNEHNCENVLDPLAGTGKLTEIREHGYTGRIYLNDLEPEWIWQAAGKAHGITTEDAAHLPYRDNFFAAVCTSPVYGNRMSDCHNARDKSRRNTYTHALGRQLSPGNTGRMQWGPAYQDAHFAIWREQARVLKDGGVFILNVSDHIRKGERIHVTDWHISCLEAIGFVLVEHMQKETPRLRFGANGEKRIGYESVITFRLKKGA